MSAPSDLLMAVDADLALADITRAPGDAGAAPPLWIDPPDGAPAPGEKKGAENDPLSVLSLFYSGGVVGQGWERQVILDVWIRTRGDRPMLRAIDLDAAIHDRWLPTSDLIDGEQRVNFLLAPGTPHELRVIACRRWRELGKLGSSGGQGYTYVSAFWFQLYRQDPGG